jgi:hypothetical protein
MSQVRQTDNLTYSLHKKMSLYMSQNNLVLVGFFSLSIPNSQSIIITCLYIFEKGVEKGYICNFSSCIGHPT